MLSRVASPFILQFIEIENCHERPCTVILRASVKTGKEFKALSEKYNTLFLSETVTRHQHDFGFYCFGDSIIGLFFSAG
jgi:hypothetical protein